MAINDDIMKQVSSFTNNDQLNDFFRNTNYSAEQLAEVSGYNLSDIQARMDAVRGGSGGNPYDTGPGGDYTQQIKADLAKLNGATDADLNSYLSSTKFTPEQLAEVSGYNASDIAARMNQVQGGASGQTAAQVKNYLKENPQLAKDYYSYAYANKGYTLDEYAIKDWLDKGAPEGYNIGLQADGKYGFNPLDAGTFKTQFSDEQQRGIAKTYYDIFRKDTGKWAGDGLPEVVRLMDQYGVNNEELVAALSKYGAEFNGGSAWLPRTDLADEIVARAKEMGYGDNFGGGSARDMRAIRELSPEEQNMLEFSRMMDMQGAYGQSPGNIPGAILADARSSRLSQNYVTQADLVRAQEMLKSHAYYQKQNGEYSDARYDPNWRQDLMQKSAGEKARTAGQIRSGEGKVSPFVSGPQTGPNAPGKSVEELAPGLMVNGIRPNSTTTTRTTSTPTTPTTTAKPNAPAPAPAKPFDGIVPTERLAEARRYGLDLNQLTQQELATFVNSGWAGLSQSRQAEWNKQAANRPANPNLMS